MENLNWYNSEEKDPLGLISKREIFHDSREFVASEDDFTSRSKWESKCYFYFENCKNSNAYKNLFRDWIH